ncbi:lipid droplet-associated hydrolase isoform X1 [Canna indica]|uniref:Lipid droplet-associated hydrolase isoform X1 n=1 Tax=Canna indica TaxID=4628 RepID=A0AAQ3KQ24_9LILI|nr:lipid droplet-associated hydrolase isoform X1 [Canna indica]
MLLVCSANVTVRLASWLLRPSRLLPPPTSLRYSPTSFFPFFCFLLFLPHHLLLDRYGLSRKYITTNYSVSMGIRRKQASMEMCTVSGFPTELIKMHSEESSLHILLIPGNPGIVSFYKDFVEEVYQLLEGQASITAIGHISHAAKDWEHGRMFSLEEQIKHKVDFIEQEFQSSEQPIILVGHSIGSYISLEIFKRLPQQVKHIIGLYPFLTLNKNSLKQSIIGSIVRSSIVSVTISYIVSFLGSLPTWAQVAMVKMFLGQSWSTAAVAATCSHLLQYHTMRNVLYMAKTEFEKLSKEPDWMFMKRKQNQISLLFGIDDHWGPLAHFEEVSGQVPNLGLSVEREGHTHAFCCTEAGSFWVADYVATLIRNQIPK